MIRLFSITTVTTVLLLLIGCGGRNGLRGSVSPAGNLEVMNDFEFVGQDGRRNRLSEHLGDYTVLSITRCDLDTHEPALGVLREILNDHTQAANVRVVGMNIHWSERGCRTGDHCHLVDSSHGLGTICDSTGAVHRLYGAHSEDRLIAIGPDHTVQFSSPASEAPAFRQNLRTAVQKLAEERGTVDDYLDPDK